MIGRRNAGWPVVALAFAGLLAGAASPARAGLTAYVNLANEDATKTFLATNISTPTVVDIGTLTGYNTYEFIVNGTPGSYASEALMGQLYEAGAQAIKFDQYDNSNHYGATIYGVQDYSYSTPTTFGADTVLDFVAIPGTGTELFVDGVDTGSLVTFSVSLSGLVGLGGSTYSPTLPATFTDLFKGTIIAAATYNSDLSDSEILAHSNAFFSVPEPSSLVLLAAGLAVLGGIGCRRRSLRLPPGTPRDRPARATDRVDVR